MRVVTLFSIFLLFGIYANASENKLKTDQLEPVVMTATGKGYSSSVRTAPATVLSIDEEELKRRPLQNLTQALNAAEGISIINAGTNENDISIRGLGGEYTLILVDGKRLNTREARGRGGSGFEHGWMPPVEMIDRIEVIKGSMSTLYGSDAMGGVINIITKKHVDRWQGTLSAQSTIQEERDSRDIHQTDFALSGPLQKGILDLHIFGMLSHRDEDRRKGGFQGQEMQNLGGKLIFKPGKDQDVTLEVGQQVQTRKSTDVSRNRTLGEFSYPRQYQALTYNAQVSSLKAAVYVQNEESKSGSANSQTQITPEIQNIVAEGKLSFPLGRQLLTLGGQFNQAKLKDSVIGEGSAPGTTVYQSMAPELNQRALFIEDEIFLTEAWNTTLGLRQDWHENYGDHFSPRIYSVYEMNPSWTFKGGISGGFKTPNIRAITPHYTMPTGGPGGTGIIYGNPELQPEKSITGEMGFYYSYKRRLNLAVTAFITDFEDKIINYNTGELDDQGFTIWKNLNADTARIRGLESSVSYQWHERLNMSLNYTLTDSRQSTSQPEAILLNGKPLTSTPKHAGNIRFEGVLTPKIRSYVMTTYQGERIAASTRGGVTNRSAYLMTEWGASYQMNSQTELYASVLNLENQNLDFSEEGYVMDGRRYWMSVRHRF